MWHPDYWPIRNGAPHFALLLFPVAIRVSAAPDTPLSSTSIFAPAYTPANTIFDSSMFVLAVAAVVSLIVGVLLVYSVAKVAGQLHPLFCVCSKAAASGRNEIRAYLELTKPRITMLILVCTVVGYWFGGDGSIRWAVLVHTLLGTALMASGTSALNQWYELDSDAKMLRTRKRPLPAGKIKRTYALAFGLSLSALGFADLWCGTNLLAAVLGLLTLLVYILVYTPLKHRSAACTTIGAIPGAMPPLIGYAASGHGIDRPAVALFLILFVWQFPHFEAIAWMYREDYARGGIRMLPAVDPDGEATARRVVAGSLLLIPISLLPTVLGMVGTGYAVAAVAAGIGVLYFAGQLSREKTMIRARTLLLVTVVYLPLLFAAMMIDRFVFEHIKGAEGVSAHRE